MANQEGAQANGFNVVQRKPKKVAGASSVEGVDVQVTNVPAEFGDVDALKRRSLFGKYGRVVKVNIVTPTTKGKNAATVNLTITYSSTTEAGLAAHCVDGATLLGQTLTAKCSSPSPTTDRPSRPNGADVKFLPSIPKAYQAILDAAAPESAKRPRGEGKKESKTHTTAQSPTQPQPEQQPAQPQQKPITAPPLAPGVSAWSKPLVISADKTTTPNVSSNSSSPTNTTTAAPAASTKPANVASPTQQGSPRQSQTTTKQQAGTTSAAAVVRGNKAVSGSPTQANGGNVTLPAALSKFAAAETVQFGGDEGEGAPKMSNILDQPAPTGPISAVQFGSAPADRGLFDADQHINSVLSDSGAIDNTPPQAPVVSHTTFDTTATAYPTANGGQINQYNNQRRPGSGRGGHRGQGLANGVSPALAPQPHPIAQVPPPHFNMGRTKLNPEAPEFYPAVRNPVMGAGMPLNDGHGMYGGGMYDQQHYFPQQVPWGYQGGPPAGGAQGAPFGGPPRGYWGGEGYGYHQ